MFSLSERVRRFNYRSKIVTSVPLAMRPRSRRAVSSAVAVGGLPPQGGGIRVGRGRLGRAVRGGAAAGHGAGRRAVRGPARARAARAAPSAAL